jgi:Calcineurin-like phosphoesterase
MKTRKSPNKSSQKKHPATPSSTVSQQPSVGTPVSGPVFAEPSVTPDPSKYKVPHASDSQAYGEMDALIKASKFLPLPFPSAGVAEPVLTLAAALGSGGASTVAKIQQNGRVVFQSAGDTGSTRGPQSENQTVDKMLADFQNEPADAVPQFFYNVGDIVYSFGEHKYYYDQFYAAYRNYPRPIFAIPGNHDGIVLPPPAGSGNPGDSLNAFLANFCSPGFAHAPDAVGISRTTMIQPGVYFTLEAPFVRILGIYSNMLENPGVISSTKDVKSGAPKFPNLSDAQLEYLDAALSRVKSDNYDGALLIAVHHPPYAFGNHSGSMVMLKEIDAICSKRGVWPHAVLSGHAHNYQRFTRHLGSRQIPYLVCGNGGHGLNQLSNTQTIRTPQDMKIFAQPEKNDSITFESYDDKNYGYLRILADPTQLRIEYHPASDGAQTKTPDDSVTVNLADGTLIHYMAPA